ncbi:MAG TPA: VWA domain-containing protein [Kofleriaceae bacterium]|jgi:uncharacterized membrane protein
MSFEHVQWLWLGIAASAVLAAAELVRRRRTLTRRRAIAIIGRVLIVVLLAAAAAEPRWAGHRRDATVVFLVDRSASISDDELARAWSRASDLRAELGNDERAAAVEFDSSAEVAIAPGDPWTPPARPRGDALAADATDISAAIRLGLGLIPPGSGGHLVLLGDGRATAGELPAALAAAVMRGIPISVIPTGTVKDDPAVAAIVLDEPRVKAGATVTGHIDVDAGGVTGSGRVEIKVAGKVVATQDVALAGGHTQVPFTYSLPPELAPGVISVDASLAVTGAPDKDPSNDTSASRLVVERPPHVVILDGDDGGAAPLAAALKAEQMDVTVTSATDGQPPDLASTDLVIMANAPVRGATNAGVVDDELGERLVKWVNNGGGLVVMGGPSAFDGNYAANRLADALPVEIEPMTPELDTSATVIVILDMSGSMGAMVGGQTKLALAAEGASAVIRVLRSFDHVGVEAVEDRVHWTVPVRTIGGDSATLERQVRDIEVGGDGIFIYTSLVAAKEAMDKAPTPLKHVILFSDSTDAAEQVKGIDYGEFVGWPSGMPNSLSLAKEMHDKGVTISVIGVGEGRDSAFNYATYQDVDDDSSFLRELARVGGGRYYRTTDAKQLRGLFVQDARRLLDNKAREEDISLTVRAHYSAIDGLDMEHAPPLHGYQELKPRPAAQVVLTNQHDDPMLVRWPYGLGEVAVWTSDAGPRWSQDWLKWPGYSQFWTQLARASLRRREGDAQAIEADVSGGTATVRVVRRDERGVSGAVPKARVVTDGKSRDLPLRVTAPGTYEARVDVPAGHEPTVEVVDEAGKVTARRTIVRPASNELRVRGPDTAALAALAGSTGGHVNPPSISAAGRETTATTPLTAWCLLLALLLLPLDASLRRVSREI